MEEYIAIRIILWPADFYPACMMIIKVPVGADPVEYIDMYLDDILSPDFRYAEWEFA